MSAFNNISVALNQRLQGYATTNSITVAWENTKTEPSTGTNWIRPTVLSADVDQVGIASSDSEYHLGIYQIDVFVPIGTPKAIALELADSISDYFTRGLSLTYNSTSVRIGTKSIGTGTRDNAWYQLPVFINYHTFE